MIGGDKIVQTQTTTQAEALLWHQGQVVEERCNQARKETVRKGWCAYECIQVHFLVQIAEWLTGMAYWTQDAMMRRTKPRTEKSVRGSSHF